MTTDDKETVNHPSHYTAHKGLEVIDLTEQMNFNRGNAVKYIARAGLKNPETEIEDLKKAEWYIHREIERLGGSESDLRIGWTRENPPPKPVIYIYRCPECQLALDPEYGSEECRKWYCHKGHGHLTVTGDETDWIATRH